jgi:hypothetical protein
VFPGRVSRFVDELSRDDNAFGGDGDEMKVGDGVWIRMEAEGDHVGE